MQRAIERRGIATVSLTVAKDVSEMVRPPRALFLPFMMGHHFGVPFHRELQRKIILTALGLLESAKESGEVASFPMTWAEARKQGKAIEEALGLRGSGPSRSVP